MQFDVFVFVVSVSFNALALGNQTLFPDEQQTLCCALNNSPDPS